jgi:Tripartite tricarboxylate transporter family receptor
MRERWPLSIVGEGLRPARLAPPQVWAELPLKRCHAQAVRAAMLLRLRQEPPTTRAAVIRDPSNNFRNWPVGRNPGGDTVIRGGVDAGRCAGLGTPPHLAALAFTRATGTVMAPISYRGAGPAVADLVAGHVPIIFLGLSASAPQEQSGKLRALAVTGRQRVAEFSDIPTFRKSGVDLGGLEDRAWFGIAVPTGTPAAIIEKLNSAVNQVLIDPKTRSAFETKAFATVVGGMSLEFGTFLRTQQKSWRKALEAAGVHPN